ncbi:MAG: hypothetical protein NTV70_01370 [Acidobacteria bacterium]|nr:hypothetical protein [Acidobacteriota bacterium]
MDFSFVLFLVIVACGVLAGGVSGIHHLRKKKKPVVQRDLWYRGEVDALKLKSASAGRP